MITGILEHQEENRNNIKSRNLGIYKSLAFPQEILKSHLMIEPKIGSGEMLILVFVSFY